MNRASIFVAALLTCLAMQVAIAQEQRGVIDRLLQEDSSEKSNAKSGGNAPQGWSALAAEMRRISRDLPQPKSAQETLAAQSAVVDALTNLLAKAKSSSGSVSSQAAKSANADPSQSPSGNSTASPGDSQQNGATGQGAAPDGKSLGNSNAPGVVAKNDSAEELVRRAWGQLPGRVRDRLQSGTPEKFHEKYRLETESYFKRLAELEQKP